MQSQNEQQIQIQALIRQGNIMVPQLPVQNDISPDDKIKVEEAFYVKEVEIQGLKMQ